jgi:hypothetical protein
LGGDIDGVVGFVEVVGAGEFVLAVGRLVMISMGLLVMRVVFGWLQGRGHLGLELFGLGVGLQLMPSHLQIVDLPVQFVCILARSVELTVVLEPVSALAPVLLPALASLHNMLGLLPKSSPGSAVGAAVPE